MSLSSLDSEQDDPFSDQHDSGSTSLLVTSGKTVTVTGRRTNRTNGGASTHSLNEADLQVNSREYINKCFLISKHNDFFWKECFLTVVKFQLNNSMLLNSP